MTPAPHTTEPTVPAIADVPVARKSDECTPIATEQLYRRYADRIRALARRAMSSALVRRVEVDDIVQSVFRRFFKAVDQGRYAIPSGEDLGDLLVAITLNRVRSEEAYHRAKRRDLRKTTGGEGLAEVPGPECSGDDLGRDLPVVVNELIESLPPDHRQVVADRMEGFEVAEIAARIGRSKRTVERMLQDARSRLKTLLADGAT